MNLPGTFRQQKPIVIVSFLTLACFTWKTVEYVGTPDAKMGLLVLPVFGWLLFAGLMVWYSMEKDADRAWLKTLEKYKSSLKKYPLARYTGLASWVDHPQATSPAISGETAHTSIESNGKAEVKDTPEINVLREIALPEVNGFDISAGKIFAGQFAFHFGIYSFSKHSFHFLFGTNGFYFGVWLIGAILTTLLAVGLYKYRGQTVFRKANCRLIPLHAATYRSSHFYHYYSHLAADLGFSELGDFHEFGFKRTAFVSRDGDVLLEIGTTLTTYGYKIKTVTNANRLIETSSLSDHAPPGSRSHLTVASDSLAYALKLHAQQVFGASTDGTVGVLRWTSENLPQIHNYRRFRKEVVSLWS